MNTFMNEAFFTFLLFKDNENESNNKKIDCFLHIANSANFLCELKPKIKAIAIALLVRRYVKGKKTIKMEG